MGELTNDNAANSQPLSGANLADLTGQQIGRYRIERPIGSGGVATVYQAYDQVQGLPVALKVLLPSTDTKSYDRFRREALMAGALRHPHIVRILQVGNAGQGAIAYIAMELVEGQSLAALLGQRQHLQPHESCQVLASIARALDHAHRAGIVHRDVKPSNILLRSVSPSTTDSVQMEALDYPVVPLLSDFGIARFMDAPELTNTGRTVGTPAYMAPEQCAGRRDVDGRADIYALGMVLYRCVTGRLPFTGTVTQILHAHVYEPLAIDADTLQRLPPVLVQILQRSLAKNPEERYASAGEMADALMLAAGRSLPPSGPLSNADEATATLSLDSPGAPPLPLPPAPTKTILVPGLTPSSSDITPQQEAPRIRPTAASVEMLEEGGGAREDRLYRLTWALLPVALSVLVIAISFAIFRSTFGGRSTTPTVIAGATVPPTDTLPPPVTATANPPASPTPTVLAQPEVVVINGVNIRRGPSTDYDIIGEAGKGERFRVIGKNAANNWWQIDFRGQPAWLFGELVTAQNTAAVPVAQNIPPAPTATFTPTATPTPTPMPTATATASPLPTWTPTPLPSVTPTFTPTPTASTGPTLTVTPDLSALAACWSDVHPLFQSYILQIDNAARAIFTCPVNAPIPDRNGELLFFQRGFMLRVDDNPSLVYIYFTDPGRWEAQTNDWQDGEPLTPDLPPPTDPTLFLPPRIFGKVWQQGGEALQQALGYATRPEPDRFTALKQTFPNAILIMDQATTQIFVIRQ